jgi:prophage regulatory protein
MTTKILTRTELNRIIPYSLAHVARLERSGEFPKRLKLGKCRVGWLESEVQDWIEQRAQARNPQ